MIIFCSYFKFYLRSFERRVEFFNNYGRGGSAIIKRQGYLVAILVPGTRRWVLVPIPEGFEVLITISITPFLKVSSYEFVLYIICRHFKWNPICFTSIVFTILRMPFISLIEFWIFISPIITWAKIRGCAEINMSILSRRFFYFCVHSWDIVILWTHCFLETWGIVDTKVTRVLIGGPVELMAPHHLELRYALTLSGILHAARQVL